MRHVRRRQQPKPFAAGLKRLAIAHRFSRVLRGKIVNADDLADERADGRSLGCRLLPLVQRTALVGLEMAESYPPQLRRVDQLPYGLVHQREKAAHPSVIEQRLI